MNTTPEYKDNPSETEQAQRKMDSELLNRHIDALAEHFSSVRIFVTRPHATDSNATVRRDISRGDFFASYGAVRIWLLEEDARHKEEVAMEVWKNEQD